MSWRDKAEVVTDKPAWTKQAETVEAPKEPSAEDKRLAADVGTLLGPDTAKRARVEGQMAGRASSAAGAAKAQIQQGTLRELGDELYPVGAASGLPAWVPPVVSIPAGAARMAVDPGARDQYTIERERLRGMYEGAEEAHPIPSMVGNMVGGAVGPQKIVGGALDAAVSGAGSGEDAASRGIGGAVGGTVGGVVGGALEGGQRLLSGIYDRFAPTARNVEKRAAGAVEKAIGDSGQTAQQQADLLARGQAPTNQPTVLADIGEPTGRLAQTAANISPEADRLIRETTKPRFENQADRARAWWDNVTGGGSTLDTQESLRLLAKKENKPRYDAAYAKGQSVWDDELQQLTTSPTIRSAIKDVTRTSADEAAIAGQKVPVRNPFQETPEGTLALPEGQTPSLEFWDHVQRNLRAQEEAAAKSSPTDAARIKALRGRLNEKLDATVPEFGEARKVARGFFQADDALDAGRDFLNMPMRGGHDAERKAFNAMSDSEKELFRHGVTESVRQRFAATTDSQEVGKLFNTPEMRDRLLMALGPERKAELEQYLKVERTMSTVKNMLGQTTTARQISDMKKAGIGMGIGGAGGAGIGFATEENNVANPSTGAAAGALVGFMKGRVDEQVAVRMAQMLTSDNPEILQQGIKILSKNKVLRDLFDTAATRIGAVAGQQTGQYAGEQKQ